MKRMLRDLSKEEVSIIIEDSLSDYCCKVSKSGKKPFGLEKSISWVKTFPTFWPNFIFNANLEDYEIGEQIEQVVTRMKSGELPYEWVVGPKSNPVNLYEYLNLYGFEKQYDMSGMAIDLMKLDSKVTIPQNIKIQVVDNIELLHLWTEIVSNGLFDGNIIELCLFEDLIFNGEAVASSTLQLSTGVASIDMVATLHKSRRMGIGTAMTLIPLLDAREMGYTIGVLQASQAGEPVYRKIGFKEYCKFHVCKYCNDSIV